MANSKTPKAPRAPKTPTAPAVSVPVAPTEPSKTRRRGRPPTAKCDLSPLKDAIRRQELEALFWATANAIVDHTEYCHPGTRDHIAGLGSLTALMKSKITKSEETGAEDMQRVAASLNQWITDSKERGVVSLASQRLDLHT